MSDARAALQLTDAEGRERQALLKRWGVVFPPKPDTRGDAASKRRPLGLAIIDGPNDPASERDISDTPGYHEAKRLIAAAVAGMPEAARTQPATIEDIFEGLELPLALQFDDAEAISRSFKELRADIAEIKAAQRNEIAELKLALTEARCEVREMRAIQENARTLSRGEQGLMGPRGIPGPPGEGRVGPAGPSGRDAVAVVAWDVDAERFVITPCYSDGTRGVPLNLLGLFQSYDAATTEIEDRDLESAARASRAETERQAEAFRQGR